MLEPPAGFPGTTVSPMRFTVGPRVLQKREVVMTARHYDEEFWTPTVFESLWISVLAAAVIGGFMVGLTALAH